MLYVNSTNDVKTVSNRIKNKIWTESSSRSPRKSSNPTRYQWKLYRLQRRPTLMIPVLPRVSTSSSLSRLRTFCCYPLTRKTKFNSPKWLTRTKPMPSVSSSTWSHRRTRSSETVKRRSKCSRRRICCLRPKSLSFKEIWTATTRINRTWQMPRVMTKL